MRLHVLLMGLSAPPLAYDLIASLARPGSMPTAVQQSLNDSTPQSLSIHLAAVIFWSISTFRGGVFALATMAVRTKMAAHRAR